MAGEIIEPHSNPLKEILKGAVILALALIALYFLMADVRNRNNYVYYDCTMASFHPDIPPKVKEACRNRYAYDQDMQQRAEQEKLNKK
jgi:hypothetical protein